MKFLFVVFSILFLSFGASATEVVPTEAGISMPGDTCCKILNKPQLRGSTANNFVPGKPKKPKANAAGAVNSGK
jgi:hypothetical protein